MCILLNYKTAKKLKMSNYNYNKLNKIRYCMQLDKELVHTTLKTCYELTVTVLKEQT
jgi:hypothetical protein